MSPRFRFPFHSCRSLGFPLALFALFALLIVPESGRSVEIDEQKIDSIFSDWGETTPGGAVGLMLDGELIYANAFGMADLGSHTLNSLDTKFNIASVSKMFTAFTVLLLEERNLLSLEDEIHRYLPELPDFGEPITIYHLLHHFSGLRNWNTLMAMTGRGESQRIDQQQVLQLMTRQGELNHSPGARESYSNTNFYLLAIIVERVSGQSFREFTRDHIFAPLEMSDTFFRNDLDEVAENQAWGYVLSNDGTYVRTMPQNNVVGAGNLVTTLNDFVKWEKNLSSLKTGSEQLINKLYANGILSSGVTSRFAKGMGYSVTPEGLRTRGMSGGTTGFRSDYIQYPDSGLTVIVLSNSVFDLYSRQREIIEACCTDEINTATANLDSSDNKFMEPGSTDLHKFAGAYKSRRSNDVVIVEAETINGALTVSGLEFTFRLKPVSDTVFESFDLSNDVTVTFLAEPDGQPTLQIAQQGLETFSACRLPDVQSDLEYLQQFVGLYRSGELESGFELLIKDGQLYRTGENIPDRLLTSQYKDLFMAAGNTGTMLFERGSNDAVAAFRISVAGVSNLHYEKQ